MKKNRKNLHAALDGLCWAGAARHVTEDNGHGRAETRSHLVMDAPAEIKALFPHGNAVQYWVLNPDEPGIVGRLDLDGTWWAIATGSASEPGEGEIDALRAVHGLLGAEIPVEVIAIDPVALPDPDRGQVPPWSAFHRQRCGAPEPAVGRARVQHRCRRRGEY